MRNAKSAERESQMHLEETLTGVYFACRNHQTQRESTFSKAPKVRFCIPHVADSFVEKPEAGGKSTRRPALAPLCLRPRQTLSLFFLL